MGKHDIPINIWLSDKERFADLYNGAICDGEIFFQAKDLQKLDTKQNLTFRDQDNKNIHIQRFRDITMQVSDGTRLILLTCENQDKIHYAMPVREMLYDSLDYIEQIKNIAKKNRIEKNYHNSAEFLSGFTASDRLSPVIPLVFYYGDEEWDSNQDLHSLLDLAPETYKKFKEYIPNYKINLVDARKLASKNCLHTDLQQILGMLEYKKDKANLLNYIHENQTYFENLDEDSYYAAKAFLGTDIRLKNPDHKGGTVNMCKALDDFYQDGVNEGVALGIERGIERGEDCYRRLILKLSAEHKTELIVQTANDPELLHRLYKEYNI